MQFFRGNEVSYNGRSNMSVENNSAERRKHKRYKVKRGAYAVDTARPGLIEEIGLGGMSFRYIERKTWPEDNCRLDIVFGEDENLRLDRFPYRVVSEHEISDERFTEVKVVKKRRVAFGDLSDDQVMRLRDFILFNTVTEC